MKTLVSVCGRQASCFVREQDGLAATEYAIMLALLVIAALGALQLLGVNLTTTFSSIADNVPGASPDD